MMVLGSLQQQMAAALCGPLRSFPGFATPAAEAARCDSERLDVWGVSVARMASTECGLQLKLGEALVPLNARFPQLSFPFHSCLEPFHASRTPCRHACGVRPRGPILLMCVS